LPAFNQTHSSDSSNWLNDDEPTAYLRQYKNCKSIIFIPVYVYEYVPVIREPLVKTPVQAEAPKRTPFLVVHGNVLYNLNYYSNIDTPYNEQDIYQHTIQTYLDVTVKGKYPMRVYLTNRFSNSSLFRNLSDLNFSWNNTQFKQTIKEQIRKKFLASLPSPTAPDSLRLILDTALLKLKSLEQWMKNPALLQKMVEARELALKKAREKGKEYAARGEVLADSALNKLTDSILNRLKIDTAGIETVYNEKKQQADSLRARVAALQLLIRTTGQRSKEAINSIYRDIEKIDDPAKLKKIMETLHIGDSVLPKGYKVLMAIRSFGIGRSVVNYSELSAKNISINGLQTEYNPGAYYALATGSVDYRFRDFIVRSPRQSGQYLTVLRYGRGFKDGNNVILTWFNGRRQLYNAGTVDSQQVQVPSAALMGLTVEGNYKLTDNILVTGEVAKSSYPSYARDSSVKNGLAAQMLQMNKQHNTAWSLKANTFFPKTQTTLKGSFKRLGANFQSFSTFTDGSAQTAWSAGIQQLFFKRQLALALSANTNDFSNPFIGTQYKSTTVFKSVQATLRKPKWPVISLGYFPSSQITKLGDDQFRENLFYTLTGNVTHSYNWHRLLMNTAVVYTQFYNRSSDSGFVYFNTKNLLIGQSVFLQQLTLQANASGAFNQDYRLYTLEGKGVYALNKFVMLGAGIKYNHQTAFHIDLFGYSAEATLQIPKFGQVQFSADKGYMPGMNKQLVPNNTGRATYFKTF
jgi:hypothetical protein